MGDWKREREILSEREQNIKRKKIASGRQREKHVYMDRESERDEEHGDQIEKEKNKGAKAKQKRAKKRNWVGVRILWEPGGCYLRYKPKHSGQVGTMSFLRTDGPLIICSRIYDLLSSIKEACQDKYRWIHLGKNGIMDSFPIAFRRTGTLLSLLFFIPSFSLFLFFLLLFSMFSFLISSSFPLFFRFSFSLIFPLFWFL